MRTCIIFELGELTDNHVASDIELINMCLGALLCGYSSTSQREQTTPGSSQTKYSEQWELYD